MRLKVQVVVGYMYKVQKNKLDTSKFRKEFAAVRHGDYFDFFNQYRKPIDFIVTYKSGIISKDTSVKFNENDFLGLVKVGESLDEFYKLCFQEYGNFLDDDISDEIFEQVALFELSLRMHLNNNRLTEERIRLEEVINKIRIIKNLSKEETESLHNGRRFLNNIKRPENNKQTWAKGIADFNEANSILKIHKLYIV